jgi:hypothetical protein
MCIIKFSACPPKVKARGRRTGRAEHVMGTGIRNAAESASSRAWMPNAATRLQRLVRKHGPAALRLALIAPGAAVLTVVGLSMLVVVPSGPVAGSDGRLRVANPFGPSEVPASFATRLAPTVTAKTGGGSR